MQNIIRFLCISFLYLLGGCAFKGNTLGYITVPGTFEQYELTDKKCPEQPSNGDFYRIFWYQGRAMGCYTVNNNSQTATFVIAGNRSFSGHPESSTYTFSQLNQAREINRAASDTAILQVFGNKPQPQPVQIQPFTCTRTGAYTTCQ